MVELIVEIVKKSLLSLAVIMVVSFAFSDLLSLGESPFQSKIVFSFYIYCMLALFTTSRYKLFHVLSIPVFTQFIHIFQKFSFTTGANSPWRLLPFALLGLYFFHFFLTNKTSLTKQQKMFLLSWIMVNAFLLFISPNLSAIAGGGMLLYLILLPQYFLYLNFLSSAHDFRSEIEKSLFLLFLILATGTFGLIYFAAGYKGTDNLLATRNIADTNVTMAYFILLWPFALLYAKCQRWSGFIIFLLTAAFIAIVVLSFSRGAVLIIIPYLAITLFLTSRFLKWMLPVALLLFFNGEVLISFLANQDLAYFWSLRFGDIFSSGSFWGKLQSASGRIEIQNIAYELFLEKPLTGHGIGSFEVLGPGFREAHSLFYTLLAEEGLIGTLYIYFVFLAMVTNFFRTVAVSHDIILLITSLLFYLLFNHTVGSVFVIIPGKSISINCIAPILLLCLFFYSKSYQRSPTLEQAAI